MDGFIPIVPKYKEVAPYYCHGLKGSSGAGIDPSMYTHTPNLAVLLKMPLFSQVAVKYVSPSDGGLFLDQFMVAHRGPSLVDSLVRKPCIKSVNQKVEKTGVTFGRLMCFTEVHKEIVLPEAARGISTAKHVVPVLWVATVKTTVSSE
jgi:hypothetical protein